MLNTTSPTATRVLVSNTPAGRVRPFVSDVDVRMSSRGALWEDALVLEVDQVGPAEMSSCYLRQPTIVLHLGNPPSTVERLTGRRRYERLPATSGMLQFDPPNTLTGARWDETLNVLILMPTELTVQRALMETKRTDSVEFLRANNVYDPQIAQIGLALLAECQGGFGSGRLYGEALSLALVSRLLAQFTNDAPTLSNMEGGLPLWRLRQVVDYIEANLGADLKLADIAQVAGMSEFHFCRLFKQSTGVAPHRWVVNRRIKRAQELLAQKRLPIAEVGRQLGFGSAAHFATAFKKTLGMTPRQFRERG